MIRKIISILILGIIIISSTKDKSSHFINLETIDISQLPNIPMMIFGINPPHDIPKTKKRLIYYDVYNTEMIIVNSVILKKNIC